MQGFGQFLLMVEFFVTLLTGLTAVLGALTRNQALIRGARYGLYAVALLSGCMALVLTHGFLTHDFSNTYIAAYSDRSMPTIYLLASFWGGEKGALLFWTTSLSIFSAIAVHRRRNDRDPVYLAWVIAVLLGALFFFFILMVFESSPFEVFAASAPPVDGKGLNPLLQNPTMAFHPPSLLTGYICFTIPFAFAVAALITGQLDNQWITDTRVWSIVSWCFLSVGLVLGMLWAYEELGWGFYWMWDPVENAGAIPWFTGTAFLHSVMIQERRGMFKRWNIFLVTLTFFLTIAGTFLTRSQLIDSIHAFANSTLANYFLVYMAVIAVVSAILLIWRWKALKSEAKIESMYSRESMFVLNNLFLVGCAFVVIWGTIFPKVSELGPVQDTYNWIVATWNSTVGGLAGPMQPLTQALALGEGWFNGVLAPIGVILLFIMGVGPIIPWRNAATPQIRRYIFFPFSVALVVSTVGTVIVALDQVLDLAARYDLSFSEAYGNWAAALGVEHAYVFFAYVFVVFVTWTIVREFHQGTLLRKEKGQDGYFASLVALIFRTPRRYGGYIIHLGVVLTFVAFTGKVFKDQAPERPMRAGDVVDAADYSVTYSGATYEWNGGEGYASTKAALTVLHASETVSETEVDALVDWLLQRDVGIFHVTTSLGNPKMLIRFDDVAQQARLRDDFYLGRRFVDDFVKVGEHAERGEQIWRLRDQDLIAVVPRLAMQKIREARKQLGMGSTVDVKVVVVPGSSEITLAFPDIKAMQTFDVRIAASDLPDDLLYVDEDIDTGGLAFISGSTGMLLHPEVRNYPKHETPTTETAIVSSLHRDLYFAMRPAGGPGVINVLTVVFPLVSFLWAGAIVLLFGTLICLTPRWLAQTFIGIARAGRTASTTLAGMLFLLLALGLTPVVEADILPQPQGIAPPAPGEGVKDVWAALSCPCGDAQATILASQSLAEPTCDCDLALKDRGLVRELMGERSRSTWATGRAKLAVLHDLVGLDASFDLRLRYDPTVYEELLRTTKTTCPGEKGLVLSQSQLGCSVRNLWLPRFRVMLAAGMDATDIHRFYVRENNVTMAPSTPWSYDDLKAHADRPLSWVFPIFLVLTLGGAAVLTFRGGIRRGRTEPEQKEEYATLSPQERLLLEDELDLLDG